MSGLPILAGALLVGASSAFSQLPEEPVFTVYGMQAGLSQGTVNALYQDEAGFIWIGTQDGLNRFDGVEFVAFKHSPDDFTSLSDDYVLAIVAASGGRLWVGTDRGGLNLFDPLSGSSEHYGLEELGPWTMFSPEGSTNRKGRTVSGIMPLADGSLVLATDIGLVLFAPWEGAEPGFLDMPVDSLTRRRTSAVCGFHGGGGLAGFSDGSVWRIGPQGSVDLAFRVPEPVRSLRCARAEASSLGTLRGGVYRIEAGARAVERLAVIESALGRGLPVTDMVRGAKNELWIATEQGLYLASEDGLVQRVGTGEGSRALPVGEIIGFLEGQNGTLWVGTWNGLARAHPLSHQIRRVWKADDKHSGISGNGVVAITDAGGEDLWVGSLDGGVDRILFGGGEGSVSVSEVASLRPWDGANVFDLARDNEGKLWIAMVRGSVALLDPANGQARAIPVVDSLGNPRTDSPVYSVFVDRSGAVWAGTGEDGLTRYDPETGMFRRFRGPDGGWRFGSTWVWPIAEDAQGRLWVGAFEGGVSVIDPARQDQRLYEAGSGKLSDSRILTLLPGSRGFIWIGTQGGGLNRLDPETDSVRVYTTEDGLPHDHVEGIIEDDEGFLWISTNDGIARFDPDSEEFWVLREEVGLAGNRFFANGVFKNDRGELFFGGEDGLTILNPDSVRPRPGVEPRVELTGLRIHGQPVPLSRVSPGSELRLGPAERFFSFDFAALQSSEPAQNHYWYKLEGLDLDWVDAGSRGRATYTAVRPARYTFRVAARDADGARNEAGLAITVVVERPYYATFWFQSLVALTILGVATWVTYRRISEHRRRFDVASRLHDGIGANIASILRSVERVAPALAKDHPRREELDRVATLARRAQTETRAAVRILRKGKEADTLESLVSELRDTAGWMLHGNIRYELTTPEVVPRQAIDWKIRTGVTPVQ